MGSFSLSIIMWLAAIGVATLAFIVALRKVIRTFPMICIFFLLFLSILASTFNLYYSFVIVKYEPLFGLIYRYAELWILFFMYSYELFNRLSNSFSLRVAIILFITVLLILSGNYVRPFNSVLFLCSSVLMYWKWIRELPSQYITRFPLFWVNNGLFIYFSISLSMFLSEHYIREHYYDDFSDLWSLSNFGAMIKNLCFAYSFHLITSKDVSTA